MKEVMDIAMKIVCSVRESARREGDDAEHTSTHTHPLFWELLVEVVSQPQKMCLEPD